MVTQWSANVSNVKMFKTENTGMERTDLIGLGTLICGYMSAGNS